MNEYEYGTMGNLWEMVKEFFAVPYDIAPLAYGCGDALTVGGIAIGVFALSRRKTLPCAYGAAMVARSVLLRRAGREHGSPPQS
jgi:hypothetical protein